MKGQRYKMKGQRYNLSTASHILVPINHKPKYEIIGNVTVQIRVSNTERDAIEKISRVSQAVAEIFYLRELVTTQVQEQVRKEYPKAAFANIMYAHKTIAGKNVWEIGVEVDVLG